MRSLLDPEARRRSLALAEQLRPFAQHVLWLRSLKPGAPVLMPLAVVGQGGGCVEVRIVRMTSDIVYVENPEGGTVAFKRNNGGAIGNPALIIREPESSSE